MSGGHHHCVFGSRCCEERERVTDTCKSIELLLRVSVKLPDWARIRANFQQFDWLNLEVRKSGLFLKALTSQKHFLEISQKFIFSFKCKTQRLIRKYQCDNTGSHYRQPHVCVCLPVVTNTTNAKYSAHR